MTIDFSKISFMVDFEINLRKSISNIFANYEIMGCYFHFIKNLYYKMKKLGLTKKKDIKNNLKFLFFFKIFPYIKNESKEQYIKYIIDYYEKKNIEDNSKHIAFIKYFIKNWYGVKLMSFENLYDEDIIIRLKIFIKF